MLEGIKLLRIEFDNPLYCKDFIRLNEQWIAEHFCIEEFDRELAENPFKIVIDDGHIISLVEDDRVIGVCALFKVDDESFEFARMAVEPGERGKGYGDKLLTVAIDHAKERKASMIYLVSNTILLPAINLYRKHGFVTRIEGPHLMYSRANIIMERRLQLHGKIL